MNGKLYNVANNLQHTNVKTRRSASTCQVDLLCYPSPNTRNFNMIIHKESDFEDGFYNLYCPSEELPVLVHCYVSSETNERGFGFNIHDGPAFLPISDLTSCTVAKKVLITECDG